MQLLGVQNGFYCVIRFLPASALLYSYWGVLLVFFFVNFHATEIVFYIYILYYFTKPKEIVIVLLVLASNINAYETGEVALVD